MPRIVCACLCAAALAVLPACGSSGQELPGAAAASTGGSSTDSATSESSSEPDTAPPPETSGTESARPPQRQQPSVTVASLPIGVDANWQQIAVGTIMVLAVGLDILRRRFFIAGSARGSETDAVELAPPEKAD